MPELKEIMRDIQCVQKKETKGKLQIFIVVLKYTVEGSLATYALLTVLYFINLCTWKCWKQKSCLWLQTASQSRKVVLINFNDIISYGTVGMILKTNQVNHRTKK